MAWPLSEPVITGMSAVGSGAPTRVAHMLVWLVDLRKTESPADEWISRGEKIRNDLQCEGTSFVDSIKEDLRKSLCTTDILDLTGDIDESKMQILDLATLAAMFCKSMLREVCL